MKLKLRLSSVCTVAFELNSAIDHGAINAFTFDDLYRAIEDGNLISFLKEKLDRYGCDFSLLGPESTQGTGFVEVMRRLPNVLAGAERRKLGVENSGVCLLLAFCIEVMQHPGDYDITS